MLSQKQLNQLQGYFASQPVEVVYLFGSQATNKANRLSDIDLAVLFADSLNPKQRGNLRLAMITAVGHILHRNDAEIVDLKELPLSFNYQAIAPKQTVYSKNPGETAKFEAKVVKRYLDLKPSLQMIARRQLEITAKKGFHD